MRRVVSSPLISCLLKPSRKFSTSGGLIKVLKDKTSDGKETGVAILKLNNPSAMNALTVPMGDEFKETIHKLTKDSSIRSVVLTGEGKAFSAGGDFNFILARANDTPQNNSREMMQFYKRFLSIRELQVPVISAINGAAVGAGLCLALATDIRIASKMAKMGVTFAALGFHPGMAATHFLPLLIGQQAAAKLLLTGDLISGDEAARIGLVLEAVEQDKVLDHSLALARRLADLSSVAVQTCLKTLRVQQNTHLESNLWREAEAQAVCYASPDVKEGVAAVMEKRKAVFHK